MRSICVHPTAKLNFTCCQIVQWQLQRAAIPGDMDSVLFTLLFYLNSLKQLGYIIYGDLEECCNAIVSYFVPFT